MGLWGCWFFFFSCRISRGSLLRTTRQCQLQEERGAGSAGASSQVTAGPEGPAHWLQPASGQSSLSPGHGGAVLGPWSEAQGRCGGHGWLRGSVHALVPGRARTLRTQAVTPHHPPGTRRGQHAAVRPTGTTTALTAGMCQGRQWRVVGTGLGRRCRWQAPGHGAGLAQRGPAWGGGAGRAWQCAA